MPRRKRNRRIGNPPMVEGFKPFGVPIGRKAPMFILFEEYEAIRLVDYENLNHEEAAQKMEISRPTFSRLYDRARQNVAKAFVEGIPIVFKGGNYSLDHFWYKCRGCYQVVFSEKEEEICPFCSKEQLEKINNG